MNNVVVMPFPGRGHINPILNLCHLLSSRSAELNRNVVFTVVVTEEWLELLGSNPRHYNVRFATIPNVLPSEKNRGADFISFFLAAQSKLEAQFEVLLDKMEQPVDMIIADVILKFTLGVGNRRNIPVAAYWVTPASMFTEWYHFDLLKKHQHVYVDVSERGEEYVDYIPGLLPIKVADFPVYNQRLSGTSPDIDTVSQKARCILLASVNELEPEAINFIKNKLQIPVYIVGPNIPNILVDATFPLDKGSYFSWLDSKPSESVLYISLGSFLSVSSTQEDEMLAGLKQSGVNFLWVARGETTRLSKDCGSNGLVVEWCDQLKVLIHPSVGGFLTHCGWNSTKESVFSGVPMLTFPIKSDQLMNSKFVVEDWKNGWKMKTGSMVKREEIAEVVKRFMDLESVERKEMMERVKKLADVCKKSVDEEGSVARDIDCFIKENFVSKFL